MSTAFTAAGSSLAVSAGPIGSYTSGGFAALTFTAISEITDLGTVGRVYNLVTHMPLAERGVVKRKGSYNEGSLATKMARVTDAGQAILLTARDSDNSYYFRLTLQNGTIFYFSAQVMSYTATVSSIDTIVTADATLEIDNSVIVV